MSNDIYIKRARDIELSSRALLSMGLLKNALDNGVVVSPKVREIIEEFHAFVTEDDIKPNAYMAAKLAAMNKG